MSSHTCTINGAGLERVRYFARQLITADDMLAEQQYLRQKLRRHNRFLHGWGVVCGLQVIAAPNDKMPWRVKIDYGYALGPYGDEIYLAEPFCFDLATCQDLVPDPCEPGEPPKPVLPKSGKLYVAIRYVECESRPVRIHPLGCACEETLCEYSRIRDDFEIACLPEPPKDTPPPLLCDLELAECPKCPESPWVVLAEITLPKATPTQADVMKIPLIQDTIDNSVRRNIFRTEMLQEQLIECCCDKSVDEKPPVTDADLAITIAEGTVVEETVNYTITVKNNGPALAENVVVEYELQPLGGSKFEDGVLSHFKATKGKWTKLPPNDEPPYIAHLGDLKPEDVVVTLNFTLQASGEGGEFNNKVKVTSSTHDPYLENNEDSDKHSFLTPL